MKIGPQPVLKTREIIRGDNLVIIKVIIYGDFEFHIKKIEFAGFLQVNEFTENEVEQVFKYK